MTLDLKSVAHVNVNCSNLERSLHFYRCLLYTSPSPRD